MHVLALILLLPLFCGAAFALPSPPNPYLVLDGAIETSPFDNSTESLQDNEGSALIESDGSLWLVDDSRGALFEVNVSNGALKRVIETDALNATPLYGGVELAAALRTGDLESAAYDPLADEMFVFGGSCCSTSPHVPAVFRLVRQGAALQLDSYANLPAGLEVSGAAAHPFDGELWVGGGKSLSLYVYGAAFVEQTMTFNDISGSILGLGFTPDGEALLIVTSARRLYRLDWHSKTLVDGYGLIVPELGDTRSVVVHGNSILIGDGTDVARQDFPYLAVHRTTLHEGQPPNAMLAAPGDGEIQQGVLVVSGTAVDDVGVESVRVVIRDRHSGLYLRPNSVWGSPFGFDATLEIPTSTITDFTWSTPLSPGDYSIQTEVRDSQQLLFVLPTSRFSIIHAFDSVPPDVTVSSPQPRARLLSRIDVTGTATDDVGVASVRFQMRDRASGRYLLPDGSFGSASWIEVAVANPGGISSVFTWTAPALAAGRYFIDVVARDTAGNLQSKRKRVYFEVVTINDEVAPTVEVESPIAKQTMIAPVVINGTAEDDIELVSIRFILRDRATSLYLHEDGSFGRAKYIEVPVDNPGATSSTWSWAPPGLGSGRYFFDAQARDGVGNLGVRQRVYFDVSAS